MSRWTVVGSGPARKPLPYGTDAERREAIERAIRCCTFLGGNTPRLATAVASRRRAVAAGIKYMPWNGLDWFPAQLTNVTVAELRELLRGMSPRAER